MGKLCLVADSNLLLQPKNLQTIKENLACQVLDDSYTAGEMGDVDFLVADQVRSCDPTMALENQLESRLLKGCKWRLFKHGIHTYVYEGTDQQT